MKKPLRYSLLLLLLSLSFGLARAAIVSQDLSTGTAGIGNNDPIWFVKTANQTSYSTSLGISDGLWGAPPCSNWTGFSNHSFGNLTLTYMMMLNLSVAPQGQALIEIYKIRVDNSCTGIKVNGSPISFPTAVTVASVSSNIVLTIPAGLLHAGLNVIDMDVVNNAQSSNNSPTPCGLVMCATLFFNDGKPDFITPVISSCAGSNTVSFSSPTTHAPGTGFTWAFGDGTTAFGPTATHTYAAPGVYTVTLTASHGIVTSTSTSQITVGPPVTKITGNVLTLCQPLTTAGLYSVQTASASASYSWTATATCGSQSFSVAVTPLNASASSVSIDWAPVLAQLETLQNNFVNQVPKVTICVTNTTCGGSDCITLSGCCKRTPTNDNYNVINLENVVLVPFGTAGATPFPTGGTPANQPSVSGYVAVPQNGIITKNMYVMGPLGIAADVNFTDSRFLINEDVSVSIYPGKNVGLTTTLMQGCTYMWRGVDNHGKLTVSQSEISDARHAVSNSADPGISLTVSKSMFNLNENGIYIGATPATTSNLSVAGSIFTSRDLSASAASYNAALTSGALAQNIGPYLEIMFPGKSIKGSPVMGIPVNQVVSSYGMTINNVPLANTVTLGNAGGGAGAMNYFDNMLKAGAWVNNSNITINNNTFKNMLSTTADQGTGLLIANAPNFRPVINIGGGSTYNPVLNYFKNLSNGAMISGESKLQLINNDFSGITRKAVRIQRWYAPAAYVSASTAMIRFNRFANCKNDLYAYDNFRISAAFNDNVSTYTNANTSTEINVYVDELSAPASASYTVSGNQLSGKVYGVFSQNTYGISVKNNTITIVPPSITSVASAAVWLANAGKATVLQNTLSCSPANLRNSKLYGIYTASSMNNTYQCNTISGVGICMSFTGNCPANIFRNRLNTSGNSCLVGIMLDNYGYTGPVAYNYYGSLYCGENTFGTYVYGATYTAHSSQGSSLYYWGASNSSNSQFPNPNQTNGAVPYTAVYNPNHGVLACAGDPPPVYPGPNPPGMIISPGLPSYFTDGAINFDDNSTNAYAIARKSLYAFIVNEGITEPDLPGTDDFINITASGSEATYFNVEKKIADYLDLSDPADLYQAALANAAAGVNNTVDENQKAFNSLYLGYLQADTLVNDSMLDLLRELAVKCPYIEGNSVYQARALLRHYDDNAYTSDCETMEMDFSSPAMSTGLREAKNKRLLAYPNPAQGEFNFSNLPEGAAIAIYDMTGREVMRAQATSQRTTISTSGLVSGMYLYKVSKGNEVIGTDRFVVK